MAFIRGYIGVSVDGFIAGPGEKLDWLYAHGGVDYGEFGYTQLLEKLGTMVMGRATYDWVSNEVPDKWVYPDHDSLVVTSRPLPDPPSRVTAWTEGIDALVAHLRALPGKDAWIVGGGRLQSALIDRGAVDYLEIFVVPYLVGGGTRMWPGSDVPQALELDDVRLIEKGVVRMAYKPKR